MGYPVLGDYDLDMLSHPDVQLNVFRAPIDRPSSLAMRQAEPGWYVYYSWHFFTSPCSERFESREKAILALVAYKLTKNPDVLLGKVGVDG